MMSRYKRPVASPQLKMRAEAALNIIFFRKELREVADKATELGGKGEYNKATERRLVRLIKLCRQVEGDFQ